ncbi:MAG: bifunctional phosphoglucose/phosphomannose isomerase [Candidatus Bathyarchaeota archaeon]|nr:bifunctional phosphoglucose/phosphomannose isomerase [Candidatus Bathyarchaeota archaeon]
MPNSILDDMEEMQKIDKSSTINFYVNAASHYRQSLENAQKIKLDYPTPKNIVVAGMGGSAIGGELLKDYTRTTAKVPVEVSRHYHLPAYADKKTLAVLASYSGDTEETLSSFLDAVNRGCMVFCVSSGGNLIKYAKKLNVPRLQVQGGMPPRAALPHMLMPQLKCMEKLNLIPSFADEFVEAEALLKKVSSENAPVTPAGGNVSKTLAAKINGAIPAVYGFGVYRSVALRFKQQFNENAKVPSKWEIFSELNHNETMGWEGAKELARCYAIVFLRDKAEPVEIHSRIENTKALIQPTVPKMFEVWAQGKSSLAKMLSTSLVGDFASVYLAMLRNVDPTPVKTITVMKKKNEQNGVKQKILQELEKLASK